MNTTDDFFEKTLVEVLSNPKTTRKDLLLLWTAAYSCYQLGISMRDNDDPFYGDWILKTLEKAIFSEE